jgi:NADH-quinone oxidoreductase subunit L
MTSMQLALACTTAPLAAFAIAIIFLRNRPRASAGIVLGAGLVSLASSAMLLIRGPLDAPLTERWLSSGGIDVSFGFLLDGPSLLMGLIVTAISFCVQAYATAYMKSDPGRARFFAFLGLFAWAMLSFVYAANLLQAFIFWELVGLASFLLIGFWYEKPSAVAAAKKAFLMTRVGDVGMLIGLILLYRETAELDIATLNSPVIIQALSAGMLTTITLLLFMGVVGKSAQFPLHSWLPDAMEGPTPVSALLHSATMVAAGVFLLARFHPLFVAAPKTMDFVLGTAAFTALFAATMAMVAKDLKRVLAYSSISQLSFMLLGLGAGSLYAGMFHLTTHAVFKALLFLCAGALIHRAGSNDLVTIGRVGARDDRGPAISLIIGSCALAGLPLFAGFPSKEGILHALHGRPVVLGMAMAAAFLTAYYSFRMVFLIWRPNKKSAAKGAAADAAHAHHGPSPWLMQAPILVLAAGSIAAGFLGKPIASLLGAEPLHLTLPGVAPAVAIVFAGVFAAWWCFGRAAAKQRGLVAGIPALQSLFENGWHVDSAYRKLFVRTTELFADLLAVFETRGFDAGGDKLADGTLKAGRAASSSQSGRLQVYVGVAALVTGLLSLLLVLR